VATVLGMGLLIHALIPAMPLAVAFALAAVISPTDPIAVSAIAARTPVPQRLMHILQVESLLNDASGLVCLRFAVAAALTGVFSLGEALASFLWLALGGLAIGVGLTWLVSKVTALASSRLGDDGGGLILVTLLLPFGVYLLAERLHCSGILAAVAAGVTMSFTDSWPWRAPTRLRRTAVWDMVQLAANGSIFVLLGEQIPAIVADAPRTVLGVGQTSPWWLVVYVLAITAALAALRFAWVWVSLRMARLGPHQAQRTNTPPGWRLVLVASLAGVRGAVTLAAVLTLPLTLNDGTPFPSRDLAVLLAAGVIVTSLLVATLGLPRMLVGLELPADPSPHAAEERARRTAAEAAITAIESAQQSLGEACGDAHRCADAATHIIELYRHRIAQYAADAPHAVRIEADDVERRLRVIGLRAEREVILRLGREGVLADLSQRRIVRELDHQEARHDH
jgi:monovalent cation/hydrogen antiporter